MVLYLLFRFFTWLTLPIYYKQIRLAGKDRLIHKGPLLVVSNHPNTLMDVIQVAINLKQRLGYLANAGIFKNPIAGRIWSSLQAIPVYRKQDVPEGEERDNQDSFRACYAFLNRNKSIMILPEGSSYSEMKLREIKTGTARIALEYQAKYGVDSGLKILPFSLNYSDPVKFRSKLILGVNEAISLESYADLYEKDSRAAVSALTEEVRKRLEAHMVILENKDQEDLFRDLRVLVSEQLDVRSPGISRDDWAWKSLQRRQRLAQGIRTLAQTSKSDFDQLAQKGKAYFSSLNNSHLRDGFLKRPSQGHLGNALLSSLLLLVGFPLFLAGFLLNAAPFFGPYLLVKKASPEVEYFAIMRLMSSWFLFLIWYTVVGVLVNAFTDLSGWWIWGGILTGPLLGVAAWGWYQCALRARSFWSWIGLGNRKQVIEKQRSELVNLMNHLIPGWD